MTKTDIDALRLVCDAAGRAATCEDVKAAVERVSRLTDGLERGLAKPVTGWEVHEGQFGDDGLESSHRVTPEFTNRDSAWMYLVEHNRPELMVRKPDAVVAEDPAAGMFDRPPKWLIEMIAKGTAWR